MIPKPPKAGYKISPDIITLSRMTLEEIQNVENFTIENQFGKIVFLGKTDLTGVDLEKLVTIVHRNAEVYDDNDPEIKKIKPKVGEKLNKPAKIILYDI